MSETKKKITSQGLLQSLAAAPCKSLSDHTPGEIAHLAYVMLNAVPASLPCRMENTKRVKKLMQANYYADMQIAIFKALNLVRSQIALSDYDATSVVGGHDLFVSIDEDDYGCADVWEVQHDVAKTIPDLRDEEKMLAQEQDEPTTTWAAGVRMNDQDTSETFTKKIVLSLVNSLVKYKDKGEIGMNSMPDCVKFRRWKLTKTAEALVKILTDSGEAVDQNFLYEAMKESTELCGELLTRVSLTLGSGFQNTILTSPVGATGAKITGKMLPRPAPRNMKDPISYIIAVNAAVIETRLGVVSRSQFDGLPVTGVLRDKIALLDNVTIPPDVTVVWYANGNRENSELLWRRSGYRSDLLIMYPNDSNYSGAEFVTYFSGVVKKGGVVCYHTGIKYDLTGVLYLHLDLSLAGVSMSKAKQKTVICTEALSKLNDKMQTVQSANYYCIHGHVMAVHPSLWNPSVDVIEPLSKKYGLENVYDGKPGADKFMYVSSRYASKNFLLTNYERGDRDPIPRSRIANLYANLFIFHYVHPVTRHTMVSYQDKFKSGTVVQENSYQLFPSRRFYPFAVGAKVDMDDMTEFEFAEYCKVGNEVTNLPKRFQKGRAAKNAEPKKWADAADEPEEESEDEEDSEDEAPPPQEAPKKFNFGKLAKRRQTLGDMEQAKNLKQT